MQIISFIFSKAGMYSILAVLAISASAYAMNVWNAKTETILIQKNKIDRYEANEKVLKLAISSAKTEAKAQSDVMQGYSDRVSELSTINSKLTADVLNAEAKMQARDMEKLKRSSHAELVLSIINKSSRKQIMEFNKL